MRKIVRRNTDIFSLAFLDIIACGFGAIVLLLLIVKLDDPSSSSLINNNSLENLFLLQDKRDNLDIQSLQLSEQKSGLEKLLLEKNNREILVLSELNSLKEQVSIITKVKEKLKLAQQSLTEEMKRILKSNERDQEVGGIPVDSEYIIFIIDNSGSMETPWRNVLKEMENILDIHPEIKGIQVMNDQGEYLQRAYAGKNKWGPDTTSNRKGIIELLKNRGSWTAQSMSNPVKGITTAINNHYIPGRKISIYLLGDDLMSGDVDVTIEKIDRINTDKISGKKKARIHGIVFAGVSNPNLVKYSNFIRQLTLRNEGTGLFIHIEGHGGYYDCIPPNCSWFDDR